MRLALRLLSLSQLSISVGLSVLSVRQRLVGIADLGLIISNRVVLRSDRALVLADLGLRIVNGFLSLAGIAVVQDIFSVLQIIGSRVRYLLLVVNFGLGIVYNLLS